jgi:UDP-galactopyranose mutase
VELGVDYFAARQRLKAVHTVYTGPIDAFFGYCHGRLPYRSLQFEHQHLPGVERLQPVAVINYPNDENFTRVTEFKHLTGQQHSGSSIVREYPCSEGDPYYPVPRPENEALFKRYETMALAESDVTFVGRLAMYRYYNMDQCVGAALKAAENVLARLRPSSEPIPIRRPVLARRAGEPARPAAKA